MKKSIVKIILLLTLSMLSCSRGESGDNVRKVEIEKIKVAPKISEKRYVDIFEKAAVELANIDKSVAMKGAEELRNHAEKTILKVKKELKRFSCPEINLKQLLLSEIEKSVDAKAELVGEDGKKFQMSLREIKRMIIEYEAFKLNVFSRSGVFPKRYFGYFDLKWDTGKYEKEMIRTIVEGVAITNRYLKKRGSDIRVTDAAIATTFIAEGGALLLSGSNYKLTKKASIHPVMDVGLDHIAAGFEKYRDLVKMLDRKMEAALGIIVFMENGAPFSRYMDFKQAILGTLVMYVYEKEICKRKMENAKRKKLEDHSLEEQFILSSLVYNSGILFSKERINMIRQFDTGEYIFDISEKSAKKRWPLPVRKPCKSLEFVDINEAYPVQLTSWSAVYHILQRYGAYKALFEFTDLFDKNAMFRKAARK